MTRPPLPTGPDEPPSSPEATPPCSEVDALGVEVDALGTRCPVPIIRVARAVRDLPPGIVVVLLASDPATGPDVAAWCRMRGHTLLDADPGVGEDGAGTRYRLRTGCLNEGGLDGVGPGQRHVEAEGKLRRGQEPDYEPTAN